MKKFTESMSRQPFDFDKKNSRRQTQRSVISESSVYSSKIIKSGALLTDTKAIFACWDPDISASENLQRIHDYNLLGKSSRARVEAILRIFRQRYLVDEHVIRALVFLYKNLTSGADLDKILYFHTCLSDKLLGDIVTEVLEPRWLEGLIDVNTPLIESVVSRWSMEGKTNGEWGEVTVNRVSRGCLAALRDFGILKGAVKKHIAPFHLPLKPFCYVAFYLRLQEPSTPKLLGLPEWKLFFMSGDVVERFLMEAHQHNLLEYNSAGSVKRLSFSVETLEEYVHVLSK